MSGQEPLPPKVNRDWVIDVVGSIGIGISVVLVACRLFTRQFLIRTADWSDGLLAFSTVLAIVATVLQCAAGNYGAGQHIQYLTTYQIEKASLYGTVAVPLVQMAMSFPKIATAAVLIRIAGPSAGWRTKAWFHGITGLLCVMSALYCIFLFVQCTPVFALWTMSAAAEAKCWPGSVIAITGVVTSAWSVFVDINLALYPVAILRKLQMPLRKKVSVCVLMALGLSATICAGFKITHLRDQISADVTYDIVDLVCLSLSEMNLILISASLPMLRPFWLWLRGRPLDGSASAGRTSGPAASRSAKGAKISRRGFVSFGSTRDQRQRDDLHETSTDLSFDDLTERGARSLSSPSPEHGKKDIKVESSIVITHEQV